ncbi:MAG: carbohydrate ABC transporter permease, partial [Oscillospiraceae bacterium]|nr:carbohydrate ABC transporter permease [Oscillospiraceae bacterium]
MKLTPGDILFNIINYAFFIVFTLSCVFPFYYLFINTISDNELVTKGAIT